MGLIQIGAADKALVLIGQENQAHQALIKLLMDTVPNAILAGCLLGKFNRAKEVGLELHIDPDSHMSDLPAHIPTDQQTNSLLWWAILLITQWKHV